jgi:hypothetical protein
MSSSEFNEIALEVDSDLRELQGKQEKFLQEIAYVQSERQYLKSQLEIARIAAQELEKDYEFTVERISGDVLHCPLCGTEHDNSLVSRASILSDKDEAERQLAEISRKLAPLDKSYSSLQQQLMQIKGSIDNINAKYSTSLNEATDADFSFLEGIASASVNKYVQRTKEEKLVIISRMAAQKRGLKKEQKQLLSKDRRQELDGNFTRRLAGNIERLGAFGVNLSSIESPLDYKKLYGSGGAAESTRGILAYYLATLHQIKEAGNDVLSPFVVDTPNQQEQANFRYENIIKVLVDYVPTDVQLLICAMDRPEIKGFEKVAKTIYLGADKLLDKSKYKKLKPLLDFFESQ